MTFDLETGQCKERRPQAGRYCPLHWYQGDAETHAHKVDLLFPQDCMQAGADAGPGRPAASR